MEGTSIYEDGKKFANTLVEAVQAADITSQLENDDDAFLSGVYFGATQGYTKGINVMLQEAVNRLPDIFNQIVQSDFDMSIDWVKRYRDLILNESLKIIQPQ